MSERCGYPCVLTKGHQGACQGLNAATKEAAELEAILEAVKEQRDHAEAELAKQRELGPCGKHPRWAYKVDARIEVPSVGEGDDLVGTLERHSCSICRELADESGRVRSATLLALLAKVDAASLTGAIKNEIHFLAVQVTDAETRAALDAYVAEKSKDEWNAGYEAARHAYQDETKEQFAQQALDAYKVANKIVVEHQSKELREAAINDYLAPCEPHHSRQGDEMKRDTVRKAIADLERLRKRFGKLAFREDDPTNRNILLFIINQASIDAAKNGINGFKNAGR